MVTVEPKEESERGSGGFAPCGKPLCDYRVFVFRFQRWAGKTVLASPIKLTVILLVLAKSSDCHPQ